MELEKVILGHLSLFRKGSGHKHVGPLIHLFFLQSSF